LKWNTWSLVLNNISFFIVTVVAIIVPLWQIYFVKKLYSGKKILIVQIDEVSGETKETEESSE
jgi:hypothetical protein